MGERFLGFLNAVPFEVQYRKDDVWNDTEYRIIARGRNFHALIRMVYKGNVPTDLFFTASTIPSAELFLARTPCCPKRARRLRKVTIFLGAAADSFRAERQGRYISVNAGTTTFLREMMKTHSTAVEPDTMLDDLPHDKEYSQAFLSSLSISLCEEKAAIGRPETMEGLPYELLDHQPMCTTLSAPQGTTASGLFSWPTIWGWARPTHPSRR